MIVFAALLNGWAGSQAGNQVNIVKIVTSVPANLLAGEKKHDHSRRYCLCAV